MFGIAAGVSFIWIILMRWLAAPIIWILIFGLIGILGFGMYYTYTQWEATKVANVAATAIASEVIVTLITEAKFNFSEFLKSHETWLAFFIILTVLEAIVL